MGERGSGQRWFEVRGANSSLTAANKRPKSCGGDVRLDKGRSLAPSPQLTCMASRVCAARSNEPSARSYSACRMASSTSGKDFCSRRTGWIASTSSWNERRDVGKR